jgi:hypothetical protein
MPVVVVPYDSRLQLRLVTGTDPEEINVNSEIKEINHSINDLRIFIASNGRKS